MEPPGEPADGVAQLASPRQKVDADADVPLPRLVTGRLPVTPVVKGRPVALVRTPLVGVPRRGVTSVGLVAKTLAPVPVSSVRAADKLAELNDPNDVALPTDVTAPVRLALVMTVAALPTLVTPPVKLALVVTLLAVNAVAVPVMLVPTNALGVPSAGVTSVGLVFITKVVPVPVWLAMLVALPTDVIGPVRLALAVTLPAVSPAAVPVMLVAVMLAGVPRMAPLPSVATPVTPSVVLAVIALAASVVLATVMVPVAAPTFTAVAAPKALTVVAVVFARAKVVEGVVSPVVTAGDVRLVVPVLVRVPVTANVLPGPTLSPTLVPVPPAVNRASTKSRSVLTFVPQVSVLAPTSGLVSSRLVVVVSAMFYPKVRALTSIVPAPLALSSATLRSSRPRWYSAAQTLIRWSSCR